MKTVTIHNLKDCTAQEVYDFIAHHLLTQGQKAEKKDDGAPSCRYRLVLEAPTGDVVLKCAAGCLIPDEDYKSEYDAGYNWSSILKAFFPENNHHENLICSLQFVHDSYNVKDWSTQLRLVAEQYNLIPYNHEPDGKAEITPGV